jgi:hypothetical protein
MIAQVRAACLDARFGRNANRMLGAAFEIGAVQPVVRFGYRLERFHTLTIL